MINKQVLKKAFLMSNLIPECLMPMGQNLFARKPTFLGVLELWFNLVSDFRFCLGV